MSLPSVDPQVTQPWYLTRHTLESRSTSRVWLREGCANCQGLRTLFDRLGRIPPYWSVFGTPEIVDDPYLLYPGRRRWIYGPKRIYSGGTNYTELIRWWPANHFRHVARVVEKVDRWNTKVEIQHDHVLAERDVVSIVFDLVDGETIYTEPLRGWHSIEWGEVSSVNSREVLVEHLSDPSDDLSVDDAVYIILKRSTPEDSRVTMEERLGPGGSLKRGEVLETHWGSEGDRWCVVEVGEPHRYSVSDRVELSSSIYSEVSPPSYFGSEVIEVGDSTIKVSVDRQWNVGYEVGVHLRTGSIRNYFFYGGTLWYYWAYGPSGPSMAYEQPDEDGLVGDMITKDGASWKAVEMKPGDKISTHVNTRSDGFSLPFFRFAVVLSDPIEVGGVVRLWFEKYAVEYTRVSLQRAEAKIWDMDAGIQLGRTAIERAGDPEGHWTNWETPMQPVLAAELHPIKTDRDDANALLYWQSPAANTGAFVQLEGTRETGFEVVEGSAVCVRQAVGNAIIPYLEVTEVIDNHRCKFSVPQGFPIEEFQDGEHIDGRWTEYWNYGSLPSLSLDGWIESIDEENREIVVYLWYNQEPPPVGTQARVYVVTQAGYAEYGNFPGVCMAPYASERVFPAAVDLNVSNLDDTLDGVWRLEAEFGKRKYLLDEVESEYDELFWFLVSALSYETAGELDNLLWYHYRGECPCGCGPLVINYVFVFDADYPGVLERAYSFVEVMAKHLQREDVDPYLWGIRVTLSGHPEYGEYYPLLRMCTEAPVVDYSQAQWLAGRALDGTEFDLTPPEDGSACDGVFHPETLGYVFGTEDSATLLSGQGTESGTARMNGGIFPPLVGDIGSFDIEDAGDWPDWYPLSKAGVNFEVTSRNAATREFSFFIYNNRRYDHWTGSGESFVVYLPPNGTSFDLYSPPRVLAKDFWPDLSVSVAFVDN